MSSADEAIKAHQEIATRNAREAIRKAESTRDELLTRIIHIEATVASLGTSIVKLEQKYNIMLTARFDGKGTAE